MNRIRMEDNGWNKIVLNYVTSNHGLLSALYYIGSGLDFA